MMLRAKLLVTDKLVEVYQTSNQSTKLHISDDALQRSRLRLSVMNFDVIVMLFWTTFRSLYMLCISR